MALTKVGKDGIIGVSNSADATAITITSAEKVGIGVSSPQELLHIKDGSIVVGNGTASNSSSVGKIGFSTDSSNSRFIGIESFRGGDAANGDLRFHTFGGDSNSGERMKIDTAGIMTVLSEGRAVTTSVQQGLAKVWTQFNGTSTVALVDSFNIGSLTDRGTGDYDLAFTNDMAGNTWAAGMNGSLNRSAGVTHCVITGQDSAAGILNVRCDRNNGTGADFTHVEAIICGDLA